MQLMAIAHLDVQAEAEMRAAQNSTRHAADEGQQGRVAQTGEALLFPRLALGDTAEPVRLAYRDWFEQHAVHSLAIVPLRLRGAVIGTLAATRDRTQRPYTRDDLTLLQDLADRAALASDSARRYHEARDAIQQLDESVALLDTLIGAAPVGFGVWDTELRYVRINDTLAAINGAPGPAHLGRTLREMLPDLADRLEPLLRQVIASGEPVLDLEISGQTPAAPGQQRHWLASYYPVQAPGGPILGLGGVVVEITERKRIEQAAAELLDRERVARAAAQQATRQREEFLSIASHELKTPLTSIKASAQLLNRWLRRPDIKPARLEALSEQMRAEIERLELLVTDLLDASRIQQGRLELRPEATDLAQLAADALARVEHAPERTALHTLALDAPEPVIGQWDPARLDQVLTNLLSNALKYSPAGGTVRVSVRRTEAGDTALLTVGDAGIGIAPDEQAQLFQPFARGATARQSIGGTGLGLYISAQIVEQHSGQIAVESAPGAGSTFTVRLPLTPRTRRR
jgi:signal transduction histidine kinase